MAWIILSGFAILERRKGKGSCSNQPEVVVLREKMQELAADVIPLIPKLPIVLP